MPTPAERARLRTLVKLDSADLPEDHSIRRANLSIYEQVLAQLNAHRRYLKNIQSTQLKAQAKENFFEFYMPYIESVLSADTGEQNEIIVTLTVWAIDAGIVNTALMLAEYCLRHKLQSPPHYNRTFNTIIAEEMADLYDRSPEKFSVDNLNNLYYLVGETDMPDQVKVKLEKMMGHAFSQVDQQKAITHLERTLKLGPRTGVKKLLNDLKKACGLKNTDKARAAS